MKVIVYRRDETDLVSVVYPTPEFAEQIELIADKDIPKECPWRIMDAQDLPSADSRNRWRWTDSGPLNVLPEPTQSPSE